MKNPLVSVIVPVYNEEDYIKKCIDSLLNQSYPNFEVIIIDDGSTDNTLKILNDYKIKILKQNHLGPGIARNLGVNHSKGDLLIFVDADMEFDKDYIKNIINPIIKKETIGTIHTIEKVANKNNIWAVCWGDRPTVDKNNEGLIYRAISKKDFLKYGPFNSTLGYSDDQTIFLNSGKKSKGINAICYHNNPSSLKEVFLQSKWIGASYKSKFVSNKLFTLFFDIIFLLFIPLLILKNTVKTIFKTKKIKYVIFYPIFGMFKYLGFFVGVNKRVYLNNNLK